MDILTGLAVPARPERVTKIGVGPKGWRTPDAADTKLVSFRVSTTIDKLIDGLEQGTRAPVDMLNELRRKLLERFPRLSITGTFSPPYGNWSSDDDDRILAFIENSGAHFVWVGLGCPKVM